MFNWAKYLKRSDLIQTGLLIDGVWINNPDTFRVINPVNDELLANIAIATNEDLDNSVKSSKDAFLIWSKKSALERSRLIRKLYELIIENIDDLALILTIEQGKPLSEAKNEVLYSASFFEWFSEEARRAYGDVIPANNINQRSSVIKQAIGVCAAITPWNFPSAMLGRKLAPALAAGCTMIAKPASMTPLSANALGVLALEAGIPAACFNIIHGHSGKIGEFLCHNQDIRKLTFTGSTEVGVWLYQNSANTMKKLSLELGGNAPLIVFDDANLDLAIDGIIASKFRNSGQTCVCANRILVHKKIKNILIDKLLDKVSQLQLGDGRDSHVSLGPLINDDAVMHVNSLVADAIDHGANLICGGKVAANIGKRFFEPTIIDCPNTKNRLFKEEIFAPVLPIYTFTTDEEAVAMANNTEYGLASYIFTQSNARIYRVSEDLEFGMVGVNTGSISAENVPFGGIKMSGLGREGGKTGINEYLVEKYICTQI
ncbi:MAG: NAD-dependent succinate-semialdehyde dehydrogenase [Burkholderiales bacterium]|nr:NAD-dependent succinate-semialdehyde dehydrogenase [Burkholderiales bacterium]